MMLKQCVKCPFCILSKGFKKTTFFCVMPKCIRSYDRNIRKIND